MWYTKNNTKISKYIKFKIFPEAENIPAALQVQLLCVYPEHIPSTIMPIENLNYRVSNKVNHYIYEYMHCILVLSWIFFFLNQIQI